MKQIFFTFLLFSSYACEKKLTFENKTQQRFDNLLASWRAKEFEQTNQIQQNEFYTNFDTTLGRFLDTNKVFVNWKGVISDIKTKQEDSTSVVSCKIEYKPEEYRAVMFACSYTIRNSIKDRDSLYQNLKNTADGSEVYFDGYISRDGSGKIKYYGMSQTDTDVNIRIPYPDYNFNLLSLSNNRRKDTLPNVLKRAIEVDFQVVNLLEQKVSKRISDREWEKKTKALGLNNLEKGLNADEKQYSTRLKQYLFSDFIAEEN